ncbi:hypothetical protein ASPTUDRAFT_280207 [Aspergillus tubingensis CBS 134.48]|uniref:Uncharacterized protein n=1 Tax=Aspergillus tubingensis (strain CBS 134.48) TaxID=767770 RepID=A0A1L9NPD1_ASPTC|nr:hypothetical protein ASPTUDRAFT_280207 [Aspergillus tubingensis CBS 134.48]
MDRGEKSERKKKEGRLFDDHLFSVQQNPGRGGGRQNKKEKMRVPKRGQKRKIAKEEKCSRRRRSPEGKAIKKHPIWMQVPPGPWTGNFALRGISREKFVLGGTHLIGQGLPR